MPSSFRPIEFCRTRSAPCSSAQSGVPLPPHEVCCYYANFRYQAASWKTPPRMVAKIKWHPGELYPRVSCIVTNLSRPPENIVAFYNRHGTCEQWIKEGKGWGLLHAGLSCRLFSADAVGLQLHALAHNLGNFLRTPQHPCRSRTGR